MAFIAEDRVRDVSTSTGTGAFTVSGAPPNYYKTFDDVMATNDTCQILIIHRTQLEWEVSFATKSAADQLTRTTVLNSSNGDAAVNFSSGDKDVIMVYPQVGTTAQYLANTTGKALVTDEVNASGALFALTDASTVSINMANGFNFSLTTTSGIGTNRTLGNPSNTIVGRTGVIVITTDATNRTISFDTNWEAAGGSSGLPAISTTSGAKDAIFYWVQSSSSIIVTGILKALA